MLHIRYSRVTQSQLSATFARNRIFVVKNGGAEYNKTIATMGVILDDTIKRNPQEGILFVTGLEEKNLLASITKAMAKKEAESERLASAVANRES